MLPKGLPADAPLMKRVHDHMFRARVLQLSGDERGMVEQQQAFSLLREGWISTIADEKQMPRLNVYRDQIVWGRSPVRIDLAGGWTDTPPYCMYAGGNVVNVAIELNGQPPLQVYVKPARESRIILRSIDIGAMECISTLHPESGVGFGRVYTRILSRLLCFVGRATESIRMRVGSDVVGCDSCRFWPGNQFDSCGYGIGCIVGFLWLGVG